MMKWFSDLRFTQKLRLGFSVLLSLSVLMYIIAIISLVSIHSISIRLRDDYMPSILKLRNITDSFDRYLLRELEYISTKDSTVRPRIRRELDSMRLSIQRNEIDYLKLDLGAEEQEDFEGYRRKMAGFFQNSAQLISLADQQRAGEAQELRRKKSRITLLEEVRNEISRITRTNINGGIESTRRGDESVRRGEWFLIAFLLLAVLVGIGIIRTFSRYIMAQVGGEPSEIAKITREVSKGNLDVELPSGRHYKEEGIYASVKQVVATLKEIVYITRSISAGDTSRSITPRGDKDLLASSINDMVSSFNRQNHSIDGLNSLTQEISGNLSPVEIANRSIAYAARFLEAAMGVLYVYRRDSQRLHLFGTYAYTQRNSLSNQCGLGEGIVGQVALERKEILLYQNAQVEASVQTGMGEQTPPYLYALPLLYEQDLYGVLALASWRNFDPNDREFLTDATKIIAIYLHTAEQNEEVKRLLQVSEEAKALAEAKTQETMQINTQLEQNQEELRASAEELNQRTQELERTNAEIDELNRNLEQRIEERTHEINQQKEEILAQRDNLEKALTDLDVEKQKADALLRNILPDEVAAELKAQGKTATRTYRLTTVMFTDFVGFTQLASGMRGDELVFELNDIFAEFDRIIDHHHLEKIKTIGDAYMCAGGLPVPNYTNPIDTVLAGLEIQQLMQRRLAERQARGQNYWRVRLGINTGEVIAGVIGQKKFAYDIWGDAVNSASRMESNGEAGKVNISQNTYNLVKDFFTCEYRGKAIVKGKGEMDMYFVSGILPALSANHEGIQPNELFYQRLKEFEKSMEARIDIDHLA